MRRLVRRLIAPFTALCAAVILAAPVGAQNRAGEFDHYVLALSWMPAFCAQDQSGRDDPRCAPGRRAGWMVHGLWPQHRGGSWPEYCATNERTPTRRETTEQADIFGTQGAAWHQWNKHGRCTGLSAQGYYALTRRAMAGLQVPAIFDGIDRTLSVAPDVIEAAFIEANPELTPDQMVVTCRRDALVELRLCLTRDLEPRTCDAELRGCSMRAPQLLPLR